MWNRPKTTCPGTDLASNQVGCEARKRPAGGDVFLLDFFLYRTYRELGCFGIIADIC
jgi:hypothetical protein